jgi:hypothetical protein
MKFEKNSVKSLSLLALALASQEATDATTECASKVKKVFNPYLALTVTGVVALGYGAESALNPVINVSPEEDGSQLNPKDKVILSNLQKKIKEVKIDEVPLDARITRFHGTFLEWGYRVTFEAVDQEGNNFFGTMKISLETKERHNKRTGDRSFEGYTADTGYFEIRNQKDELIYVSDILNGSGWYGWFNKYSTGGDDGC